MMFEFTGEDSTVAMTGDFTFTDHAMFLGIMQRLFNTRDVPIVLDLSGLEFIDSAGLGMLLIARDEAAKGGRKLTLRGPKGQIKRMFAVTRFDTLFTIQA